jgi:hypothetical protein
VRDVIDAGTAESTPFTVAFTVISPTLELKKVPELVSVVVAPEELDKVILLEPAVTDQAVESPPEEVSVIDIVYPEGLNPLKYHTVVSLAEIVGVTAIWAAGGSNSC